MCHSAKLLLKKRKKKKEITHRAQTLMKGGRAPSPASESEMKNSQRNLGQKECERGASRHRATGVFEPSRSLHLNLNNIE
ncbi:hypothetical protein EYF80_042286 [Liparis tanakae]|uniref:Uncharacterized protein n=1 Tax=Liparis tanakae TaxID=230148 RepID=A0A4Z2G1U6_9TELE|nr:hypothetical protein EYF80_042286 [Liparis tanakae]